MIYINSTTYDNISNETFFDDQSLGHVLIGLNNDQQELDFVLVCTSDVISVLCCHV